MPQQDISHPPHMFNIEKQKEKIEANFSATRFIWGRSKTAFYLPAKGTGKTKAKEKKYKRRKYWNALIIIEKDNQNTCMTSIKTQEYERIEK